MNTIRIRKTIDSEMLTVPELRPLIGRNVEILVIDDGPATPDVLPGNGDWDTVLTAAQNLADYDYDAQRDSEAYGLRYA
jgi:hypothetical protein